MAHILTKIQRPSTSLLNSFNEYSAATVYEAAGRIGSVDPAIKPLGKGMRLCGPAFTVLCFPNENEKAAALSRGATSMELNKLDKVFQALGVLEK